MLREGRRGERGETGGRGGTVAFEKAPQNFYEGDWGWVEFVQVHVLPNMSDPFPEKIVRERLDGAIRRLRGVSAG